MKFSPVIVLLLVCLIQQPTFAQDIRVKAVSKNVLSFDASTDALLVELGIKDRFHVSRYHEFADFNGDGKKDFFINYAGNPEKAALSAVFVQKSVNGTTQWVEDVNYRVKQNSDFGFVTGLSADFNGDGKRDIYQYTLNYHGRPGFQPSNYKGRKNNTPDNFLLNTGKGFSLLTGDDYFSGDSTNGDYLNQKEPILLDFDQDGIPNILFGHVGGQFGTDVYQRQVGKFHLFYSYEFDSNNHWKREILFPNANPINFCCDHLEASPYRGGVVNGKDYYFLMHYEQVWDDVAKKLLPFSTWNVPIGQYVVQNYQIRKVDLQKGFDVNYSQDFGNLKMEFPYVIASDWSTHFVDLDLDGKLEMIVQEFVNNGSNASKPTKISIYNLNGDEISSQWFDNRLNYDNTTSHANGIHLVDINNDGFVDIIPQNGWYEKKNDQWGYFIFLNNGNVLLFSQHPINRVNFLIKVAIGKDLKFQSM
jgi:hypothetical protein